MTIPFDCRADETDIKLLSEIADGLPLTTRPYRQVGEQIGIGEQDVICRLQRLLACGIIRRFGLVLQHRPLGYRANAMVVWDVPDEEVDEIARRIVSHDFVTLCYARARGAPVWPYNLYCMIHGCVRERVEAQIVQLKKQAMLEAYPSRTLFSCRRFKQTGARFILRRERSARIATGRGDHVR